MAALAWLVDLGDDLRMLLTVREGLEESSDGCFDNSPFRAPRADPDPGRDPGPLVDAEPGLRRGEDLGEPESWDTFVSAEVKATTPEKNIFNMMSIA